MDGRTYTVQRGTSGTYSVVDETADAELELGKKEEVVNWLRRTFGLDGEGDVDLSTLWENCIGVPQTQFLSDFRAREGIRKKQFDPLLGIDVYEQAWSTQSTHNLKQPVDELESRKQTAKERISRLEGSLRISQSSGRPSTNRRRKSRNSATNSRGPVEACWREGGVLGAGRSETTSGRTRPNHRERRESGRGESRATRHG